MFASK